MNPNRELRLTIDARLQTRVAAILATYARKSSSGHAAAVLLDATNGDLLASVSYPWPASGVVRTDGASSDLSDQTLLDRARFGLYPPGSTFKLITAAAALRQASKRGQSHLHVHPSAGQPCRCARTGIRPAGPRRCEGHSPHGTLDMHTAIVASCNAVLRSARRYVSAHARCSTPRDRRTFRSRGTMPASRIPRHPAADRLRAREVVASPLRMARIAAAIASDGRLRDVRVDLGRTRSRRRNDFLPGAIRRGRSPNTCATSCSTGTGRVLRDAPIASCRARPGRRK
jgi:peptidoglycan glycosyltransferase